MNELHYKQHDIYKNIGKDAKLREEIIHKVEKAKQEQGPPQEEGFLERMPLERAPAEMPMPEIDVDQANEILDGQEIHSEVMEAIILRTGRPVIRIRDNALVEEDIEADTLRSQLEPHKQTISNVVQSIGRIELNGHRLYPWVGTGWIVDDNIIVTNRHVAKEFGHFTGMIFDFLPGIFGGPIEARIDFRQEHGSIKKAEFALDKVLFIEPDGGPDIALLQVKWVDGGDARSKLELWDDPIDNDRQIAVVGYPAKDTRTNMSARMDEIYKNIYNVKRFAPGLIIGSSEQEGFLAHDCTTLGGNSGSAVLDIESGKVVGLHFSGLEEEANFAVLAPLVNSRLNALKSGIMITAPGAGFLNEVVEEKPTLASMEDRNGYQPDFLGVSVPLPGMSDEMRANLAPVEGRDDFELKYTNYSVLMHKGRRSAFYAVVNIDGNQLFGIPRGSDKWYFDPRIAGEHQVGNELYKSNPLDRGHLVRRLDPSWGATRDAAELAVEDTFFYTNCAPQHLTLNRRMWLGLEDYILNNSGEFNLKVTVFSGPVFHENDQDYRGIQIPNEFWKVVAVVKQDAQAGAEELSVTGYVLSQRSLVDDLEFVFGDHQGYQVKVEVIEELTGFDFGNLKDSDPLTKISTEEAVGIGSTARGRRLSSYRDIVL